MSDFTPCDEARSAQCAIVLAALRAGPQTTTALRALGIMSPAARLMSLRRAGLQIHTQRQGRQAQYVLTASEGAAP